MAPTSRILGDLAFAEVSEKLRESSILCLPLGAIEQHGAHLPLDTDVVVAEGLARRIVARWGDEFDLWQLPTIPIGLSREHDWAPGTLSLSIACFVALMRDLARTVTRALPARNFAIINCHGGNRGVLENVLHELRGDFGLNACSIHPFDLACIESTPAAPDIHGGKSETSVMLALAPDRVRMMLVTRAAARHDAAAIEARIFDRGATWPWRSDDPGLGEGGIIGDASGASAELGAVIIDRVVFESGRVFRRLIENGQSGARSR
ncbi:MAG TPA: creatininase family protein [Xanthobacteraceae bacterium]|jgi:creatinine amidohydrolase/Fe(II)-dependent formamide hydrolase-like protein